MSPARTLVAASVLLCALIVALVWTALATTNRFLGTSQLVEESEQALTVSASLRSALRDAEDSYRGFLLTGQAEYLSSFKADQAAWPEFYGQLLALARGHPQRQELVQQLRPLITVRMADIGHGVALMAIAPDQARAYVRAGQGSQVMQQLEDVLNRVKDAEHTSLQGFSLRAEQLQRLSEIASWLCGSVAVAAVLAGTLLVLVQWRRLADAEGKVRRANASLGVEVTARTRDLQQAHDRLQTQAHELEQVNHELDAFTASVSHDLQSPLRRVEVMSDLLQRNLGERLPAAERKIFDMMVENVRQMRVLIRELLQFARLTRLPPQQGVVPMQQLAADCWQSLTAERQDRQITLDLGMLPPCQGDVHLLGQVLVNLFSNAIKYTRPMAKARIEVLGEVDGPLIRYAVRDNGVGFDMQYSDRLFDLFSRLHAPTEFEGSGVGLATARRIVERHGGRIWAESRPGAGASFYFTIPRCS